MVTLMTKKEFQKDFEELDRGAKHIRQYGSNVLTNFRKNRNMGSQTMQYRGYQSDGFMSKYPVKPHQYLPNDKILQILQKSEEISKQYSAHYRMQTENETLNSLIPKEMITFHKFMKDTTLKDEHQKMLSRLDNNIEHRVLAQDAANRSPLKASAANNAYSAEPDDTVT